MKPGPNLKQRPRGRNNNNNNGGKKYMPSRNQTYDSNGPDIRIRGNAHQVLEKYLTLARDATLQGDRIAAENYYQHAEHYFRVINSQNQANGRPNDRPLPTPADDQMAMASDLDDDGEDEDEGEEEQSTEQAVVEPVVEIQAAPPVVEQPVEQPPVVRRRRPPRERVERPQEQQGEAAEV